MFGRLFRARSEGGGNPASLYGAIVAQARSPALYADLGVPDTVEGRFEMVVLHTVLVMRRLRGAGSAVEETGQAVFDLFCRDMDRSLREMGVGDLAVPKRMRKIGEGFYGRAAAYEAGLGAGAAGLAEALARNIWPDRDGPRIGTGLAAYAVAAAAELDRTDAGTIAGGRTPFPDPAAFATAEAAS